MITVIVVKEEQYGFTLPECILKGGGCKQCRPRSDRSIGSGLILVCTVCSDVTVPILIAFTVLSLILGHTGWKKEILNFEPHFTICWCVRNCSRMVNSAGLDQTALRSSLIRVFTVAQGTSSSCNRFKFSIKVITRCLADTAKIRN